MSTENLNTDAERAEFEAAFESMFFSSCFEREADGSYAGRGLQGAWLGWQKARAAQPAPVVPEGYVLVPKSMWVDAASIEALAFVMGGPEEDDGSPTYCDCVMWVGEIDDDGVKRHGIHVYNTECEEEGSTTLAEFAAAPAQGHQVEFGDAYQGAREDLAIWKRRALEAEEKLRQQGSIIDHLTLEAQGETRMGEPHIAQGQQVEWRTTAVMLEQANAGLAQLNGKLRIELAALKAQQVGQEPQRCQCCGYLVTESEHRGCLRAAAPQPAPSQDVAGLASSDPVAKAEFETRLRKEFESRWPKPKGVTWGAGINDYCVSEFAEGIALSYPDMWMAYKAGAMRTNQ